MKNLRPGIRSTMTPGSCRIMHEPSDDTFILCQITDFVLSNQITGDRQCTTCTRLCFKSVRRREQETEIKRCKRVPPNCRKFKFCKKGELVGLPRARWANTWHSIRIEARLCRSLVQVGKPPSEDAALEALF
jgi:hypothetical protein